MKRESTGLTPEEIRAMQGEPIRDVPTHTLGTVMSDGASPLAPYGNNTIWPHDLPERVISLEAEVAALREQMARVLNRLLLPEKPSEP